MINHAEAFDVKARVLIRDSDSHYDNQFGVIVEVETTMRPPSNPLLKVRITSGSHVGITTEISGKKVMVLREDGVPEAPTYRTASTHGRRLRRF